MESIPDPFYVIDIENHAVLMANSAALADQAEDFAAAHVERHPVDRQ